MTDRGLGIPTTLSVIERALFPEAPPARLGRFEIIRQLGRGGMGVVYLATDPQLKRDVALKIHGRSADERARRRMQREAESLAQLRHRNVVTVHEVCVAEGGEVFAVMEYLPGATLDRWVEEAKPAAQEITVTLVACALGLAAAHESGLVHGDFKPGNVVLDEDAQPKVIDFGLARADPGGASTLEGLDEVATNTGIAGTPRYMAPELWRGEPHSPSTDQYAFCVTLYELLAGRPPFTPKTHAPLPPRPAAATREVWDVLRRGLDPDPAQRCTSMREVAERLANAKRSRFGARAIAGTTVAGIAVGTLAFVLGDNDPASVVPAGPAAACQVGEDFLAADREWTTPPEGMLRTGGELRLTLSPGSSTAYVRTDFAEGPISLLDRALQFEVVSAPARGETHELMIGLDDASGVFLGGILLVGGKWVFPIGLGVRGHALELGPDDRYFRIQVEDPDTQPDIVTFEVSSDAKAWRPFYRTPSRFGPVRLFVVIKSSDDRTQGDAAVVRSLRCAAVHDVGDVPYERDLTRPPAAGAKRE